MTDEERGEMEKQVKSLQESYSLLSHEALKQLQEAQYLDDEKMEEKVARWKLRYQGLLSFTAWFWNHMRWVKNGAAINSVWRILKFNWQSFVYFLCNTVCYLNCAYEYSSGFFVKMCALHEER